MNIPLKADGGRNSIFERRTSKIIDYSDLFNVTAGTIEYKEGH